jgi:Ca2+-binding RTX toxin-like protein
MSLTFSITNYPTGINPIPLAIGDLNGDGRLDLVTANIGGDPFAVPTPPGTVSVLLGNGGGTFSAATPYLTGSVLPFSVALGDLNGDGRLDLAVANYGHLLPGGDGTISVFLGEGDGTFSAATQYPTLDTPSAPQSVAIGDLNGDGKLDLAVASASNRISVLLGNGDGSFLTQSPLSFSGIDNPGSVAIADLNGDGLLDLAVANFGVPPNNAGAVSVLLGRGDGGFNHFRFTTGTNASSVAIGDLNGDSHLDLAVTNAGSNTVSVLLGNGIGGFSAATPYATGTNPESVAISDLNGDGRLDLAVANHDSNTVSVLLGNVGGGFQEQTQYPTGLGPFSVAIGDLNGDGRLDLAVTNHDSNNVTVLLNADIAPTITSNGGGDTATISIAENTTAVTTVMATDPYAGQTLSYSIIGGADAAKFTIGSSTGVLSFVTAPNFEAPIDTGVNNIYDVTVQASDGHGGIDTQAIAITAQNVLGVSINGTAGNDLIDATHTVAGQPLPTNEEDTLNGGAGADQMSGGNGNDVYFVDNPADVVIENANDGVDTVNALINYGLGPNVENLMLQGNADLQGYGNDLANTIIGNSGSNLINGGAGTDAMVGGLGNETYFVDNASDVVTENASEGNDTVFATTNFTLSGNVENLILQGNADLQGYGSNQVNTLYGNAGNNLLNAAGGVDLMAGSAGNDTYFVDDTSDACFELANEGSDAVFAFCHYGLAADVETLVLQGSGDFQGYGNNQANTLYGNAGNNLLNGAGGADVTLGGAGNDTYFVDNTGDVVFENTNEGTDAVFASVDYTLTANAEALVLQGAGNLSGTGNALANSIFGNSGDSTLNGGAGADTLTGNAGNDTFVFVIGQANGDAVVDFAGNGAAAGDSLHFIGYGAGATFTNIDLTHWQVNYNGGGSHEIITFMNGAAIDPTDVLFS